MCIGDFWRAGLQMRLGDARAARDGRRAIKELLVMKRPVFVVGCPRSGTTLLYSMLVAAGGFAFYRKETHLYALASRFPRLTPHVREQFLREFLAGYLGHVPGLDVVPLARAAGATCESPAEFLPRLMDAIAREQGVERWIEGTPAHVLYIDAIKKAAPDALIVHVIRDGRDCALSIVRQGWTPPCPWDRRVAVAALYWEWMVRAGRAAGGRAPRDYIEVRFEDLIGDPRGSLDRIGRFLEHDLDYDRILRNRVHALCSPNTSFRETDGNDEFNPVGRWRKPDIAADVRACEAVAGSLLEELGYGLSYGKAGGSFRAWLTRSVYLNYFPGKRWIKTRTPLGRVVTNASVWAEQPRQGERPVRAIRGAREEAVAAGDAGMVAS